MPKATVPDGATPIVAYRYWSMELAVDPVSGAWRYRLAAPIKKVVWPARVAMSAHCLIQYRAEVQQRWQWHRNLACRGSLGDDCRCGVYGLKTPVIKMPGLEPTAFGRVLLWGKVGIHEAGYRAQYGYPSFVFVPQESIDMIAERDGMGDAEAHDAIAEMFDAYGVAGMTPGLQLQFDLCDDLIDCFVTSVPDA